MKIETELLRVITAAAKAQSKNQIPRADRNRALVDAIHALDKKLKGKISKAKARWDKASAARNKALEELKGFGLGESLTYLHDEELFTSLGGVVPTFNDTKWTAEEVISKLAAAKPEQRDEILKEYNIDWS